MPRLNTSRTNTTSHIYRATNGNDNIFNNIELIPSIQTTLNLAEELRKENKAIEARKKEKIQCEVCKKFIPRIQNSYTRAGINICDSCLKTHTHCQECHRIEEKTKLKHILRYHTYYCSKCFKLRFTSCRGCGEIFYRDDVIINEDNGQYYCNRCWINISNIHEYSYIPSLEFNTVTGKKKEDEGEQIFIGVELEVTRPKKYTINQSGKEFFTFLNKNNLHNFFYLKRDSSIDGFEIVTHPFTLEFEKKYAYFDIITKWLAQNKYESSDKFRCGLHIHISKKLLHEEMIYKFRLFINKYQAEMFKFSGRLKEKNVFCLYETLDDIIDDNPQEGRHWAVNTNTNKGTMELRIFAGTLKYSILIGYLEFVYALLEFLKKEEKKNLCKLDKQYYLSWNGFIKKLNKTKYPNLTELFKNKLLTTKENI